jgi:putative transcriptional regulator
MPKRAKETDGTDWKRLAAMSDDEAEANALSDPDNQPLSSEVMSGLPRMPRAAVIRRALGLTQEEFSARYRIPLGTLRDWEQGRSEPDQPTRAYLRVIAAEPETTAKALTGRSAA